MFFKSLIKTLNTSYNVFNENTLSQSNPNIIRYFKNEYGPNWKVALEHHLYKKSEKNDKKAA